jgi:RNA polymerase sigma factor (sigma-70 family)
MSSVIELKDSGLLDALSADASESVSGLRQTAFPSLHTDDQLQRVRNLVKSAVRRFMSAHDPEFEDLIQTSLASVVAALGARLVADQIPAGWVVCVARNVVIDRLRARQRERRVFEGDASGREHVALARALEPDHLTHVRDELRRYESRLRRICAAQAVVVYLHDVLGHDLTETAAAVGISVSAAQSRLIRGRRAIRGEGPSRKKARRRRR